MYAMDNIKTIEPFLKTAQGFMKDLDLEGLTGLGNMVNNLVDTYKSSGYNSVKWNATNNQGQLVSAGVYFYTIETGDFRQTKKMILVK